MICFTRSNRDCWRCCHLPFVWIVVVGLLVLPLLLHQIQPSIDIFPLSKANVVMAWIIKLSPLVTYNHRSVLQKIRSRRRFHPPLSTSLPQQTQSTETTSEQQPSSSMHTKKKQLRIAIIGAGAVGSYYGARLWEIGHDVHFLYE